VGATALWAFLILRIDEAFPLTCRKCGNEVRLIALTDRDVPMPREAGKDCSYTPFAFPPLHMDVQVPRSTGCARAAITEPASVARILEHLELPAARPASGPVVPVYTIDRYSGCSLSAELMPPIAYTDDEARRRSGSRLT
jgi:hypothetical protein